NQYSDDSAANNLHRLRAILDGTLPADQLEEVSRLARRYAVDLNILEREQWQETVADTLVAADKTDLARQWISRLEENGSASGLVHAGDFHADRDEWPAAAKDYANAFEHDRTQAAALFLQGWALSRSGHASEGAPLMEQAHQLPLGNETGRFALAEALARHKLTDDLRREFDLIIHATAPRSWERNDAMRRLAQIQYDKGDYAAAADLWEQAFLQNFSTNVSFSEPWAYAVVPSLIHKTRALGLIQSNRPSDAMIEAQLSFVDAPGDADALIELVNAFDKAGHKAEADALYAKQVAAYQKNVSDYPESGPLHNQLAWAQCMCHRDLNDALKNAKRAVELEPTSTASLDTLAEAYFALGDPASAAAQMKRCVELEPKVERHRTQLQRFEAAQKQPK
ncbi:MAG TPA: hypothetical protein VLJ39_14140, partial [Tepidisphaeraceae bacterium]|nr:hypothetical protein [Tepidisphaeraceae bacterium]